MVTTLVLAFVVLGWQGQVEPLAALQAAQPRADAGAPQEPISPPDEPLRPEVHKWKRGDLFGPRDFALRRHAQDLKVRVAGAAGQPPQIVCGMKVWKVDPNLDKGIRKQVPSGDFKIRRLTAPCEE